MDDIWLILGIAWLIALAALGFFLRRAPLGYEDERGFHEGFPPELDAEADEPSQS